MANHCRPHASLKSIRKREARVIITPEPWIQEFLSLVEVWKQKLNPTKTKKHMGEKEGQKLSGFFYEVIIAKFMMLIFQTAQICGIVLFAMHHWLKSAFLLDHQFKATPSCHNRDTTGRGSPSRYTNKNITGNGHSLITKCLCSFSSKALHNQDRVKTGIRIKKASR